VGQHTTVPGSARTTPEAGAQEATGLVIVWSRAEPDRIGEVALLTEGDRPAVLGRGTDEGREPRVVFHRQRPGSLEPRPPLEGAGISRRQLQIGARAGALLVENIGRCEALANGAPFEKTVAVPGDTLHLRGQLLLLVVRRAREMLPLRDFPDDAARPFARPDALGILGESPAAWRMRDEVAFAARAGVHALVCGASGTGKELAARAIHALSRRASGPFVARNAATFPAGLIDAELFGNVKNYPNPGMQERPGIVGQAHGGTLFLDEIGELPSELQAHLLRVLDAGGEYQRLGEATTRRADIRLIGASNRDPALLKHDFLARLAVQVDLPSFEARREDIPLLVRHLLARAAEKSPELAARFTPEGGGAMRIDAELMDHLVRRSYTTNAREIEALLWRAMSTSLGEKLTLAGAAPAVGKDTPAKNMPPRGAPAMGNSSEPPPPNAAAPRRVEGLKADDLRACIAEHGGNLSSVARALGLSSRYALYRLLKKHGVEVNEIR
jgi:DNA-binding NtrC family response regulator